MVPHLTYPEAMIIGLFQGVTELFPVSSLGHSVLIPALVGGSWAQDLSVTRPGSPYLAFIVGLHVATAIAMIIYFWRDWLRIVVGFCTSIAHRRIETVDQKLAWMIVLATIPVGIVGALLQHTVQNTFAKPVLTAVFLAVNGLILFGGERLRRRELAATTRPRLVSQETWVARLGTIPPWPGTAAGWRRKVTTSPGPMTRARPMSRAGLMSRARPMSSARPMSRRERMSGSRSPGPQAAPGRSWPDGIRLASGRSGSRK